MTAPRADTPARWEEVLDFDRTPFVSQVFGHKASMTVIRRVLAAKKASLVEPRRIHGLDLSFLHQGKESFDIDRPVAVVLLEVIKNILGRGEFSSVYIFNLAQLAKEEREIVLLREAGEL